MEATHLTDFITLRTDDSVEMRQAELPDEPTYYQLKVIVEPIIKGMLEHVRVFHEGQYTDMFVDDTGALKGLPRNERATAIYRNNVLTHQPGTPPESLPAIYGDAVLFTRKVWF